MSVSGSKHALVSMLSSIRAHDATDPFEGYVIGDADLSDYEVAHLYENFMSFLLPEALVSCGWAERDWWNFPTADAEFLDGLRGEAQDAYDRALAKRQATLKVWVRAETDLHAAVTSKQSETVKAGRVAKAEKVIAQVKPVFDEASAAFLVARRVEEFMRPIPEDYSKVDAEYVIDMYRLHLHTDKWTPSIDAYTSVVNFVKRFILS